MDLSAVQHTDTELLLLINHFRSPVLDFIMPVLSDFSILLPVLVPFLTWRFWKGSNRERLMWAAAVVAVGISDFMCARVIKAVAARPRPYQVLDGIYLFKSSHWLVTDAAYRAGISGTLAWPSCHAMNMWTAASYITVWWGKHGIPVMVLAALVCWSRMYLGVHYPLDVCGGALIGILWGVVVFKTIEFLVSRNSAE